MEKCIKKIGIIGAMDSEISVLRSIMKENGSLKQTEAGNCTFNEGVINGVSAVVVKSGVGKVNAALCAQRLILQFGVDAVINTGIAGAMGGNLCIFDMAVSTDAVYHDMDAVEFGYRPTEIPQMKVSAFPADERLIKAAKSAFEKTNKSGERKIVAGRVATGDQFVAEKAVKNHIKEICSPVCVEMEGAAIAHTCYVNCIPYVILRCISDMADDTVRATYSFNEETAAEESSKVVIEMLAELSCGN
ncbi:MAG: 5'-methylthioadenosine/adenosylhomocysteine nucleosidase [Treponema porcinum]|nr:5'-methylthioadenosine/adenosylhomocysteine nucleosidase [Treponema porcinum]